MQKETLDKEWIEGKNGMGTCTFYDIKCVWTEG